MYNHSVDVCCKLQRLLQIIACLLVVYAVLFTIRSWREHAAISTPKQSETWTLPEHDVDQGPTQITSL